MTTDHRFSARRRPRLLAAAAAALSTLALLLLTPGVATASDDEEIIVRPLTTRMTWGVSPEFDAKAAWRGAQVDRGGDHTWAPGEITLNPATWASENSYRGGIAFSHGDAAVTLSDPTLVGDGQNYVLDLYATVTVAASEGVSRQRVRFATVDQYAGEVEIHPDGSGTTSNAAVTLTADGSQALRGRLAEGTALSLLTFSVPPPPVQPPTN